MSATLHKIGTRESEALAKAFTELKTNSTLATLELRLNSIADSEAQAPAEAIKTNYTLTSLNLFNNSIGSNGEQTLAKALNRIQGSSSSPPV
ncbi:hypothetical protein BGZ81_006803 [Podila clonocystis]|nr:hypothetical protein BGZ81_006803 [Podila clonocystis]